VNYDIWIFKT